MDAATDIYHSVIDAYDKIYPWIPSSFKNSISSFVNNLSQILQTVLTNPSELPSLLPSIISTILLAISLYWTLSSTYYAARRVFRVAFFLTKYGSILAMLLATVGYVIPPPDHAGDEYSNGVGPRIIAGWQTLSQYLGNNALADYPPRKRTRRKAQRDQNIWEKFVDLEVDAPSSKTRSKSKRGTKIDSKSKKTTQSWRSSSQPPEQADIDIMAWVASALNGRGGDDDGATVFERTLRQVWSGSAAWSKVGDMFSPPVHSHDVDDDNEEDEDIGSHGTETR